MRSRLGWSRAATLAICVALGACHGVTEANDAVDVVAAVDRMDIEPELPANVTITIINHGSQALHIVEHWCMPMYVVRNIVKDDVPLPGRYCTAIAYAPRDLMPGDHLTLTDRWSGETTDGLGRTSSVAPGRYEIIGRAFVDGRELRTAPVVVRVH
jgi:hypothetical protein